MDVTCGSQGLGETLFLCTTYMMVAMTPLSVSACPASHQVVGGCDMWQSGSRGRERDWFDANLEIL